MSTCDRAWNSPPLRHNVLLLLPVLAAGLGLVALRAPGLVLAGVAGVAALIAIVRWPEASTLIVVFVLYTNAASVAVNYHGVPYVVGAAFSLMLVVPLCYYLLVRGEPVILMPVLPLIVLFTLVQLAGALRAVHPQISLGRLFTSVTEGLALYFLITNVIRTQRVLRQTVWVLMAAGALMAAVPLYQMVTATYGNSYGGFAQVSNSGFEVDGTPVLGGSVQYEQSGSLGEQNRFAQMLVMLVPVALFGCWHGRTPLARGLAAAAAGLVTIGVTLTHSRGAALALGAMLLTMLLLRCVRLKHVAIIVAAVALLLAVFPQYGNRLLRIEGLWRLATAPATLEPVRADGSLEGRATEVLSAAHVFLDHPILGVGPGMFKYHYQEHAGFVGPRVQSGLRESHNLYVGLAAEHGILGAGCFLAILALVLVRLIRRRRQWLVERPELAGLATTFLLVFATFLTTSLGLHLGYVRYFWLMLGLASVAAWLPADTTDRSDLDLQPAAQEDS